jgi:hypothetical protein
MLTDTTNKMIQTRNKSELLYTTMSFPMKLHTMLEVSERLGFEDVVSWQPGGKSFKVLDADRFARDVMQDYFNQTKYKSFQRQLNLYGFKRVHHGPNKGGYIHPCFTKATPEDCENIGRRPSKDFNIPKDMNDLQVEPISLIKELAGRSSASDDRLLAFEGSELKTFYDFFNPEDPAEQVLVSSIFSEKNNRDTNDEPPAAHCRSLDLFIRGGDGDGDDLMDTEFLSQLSKESCHGISTDEEELESEHSFPFKLHLMLEHAKKENFQHIVSWVKDGSAFKVHSSRAFVEKVMPNYFDQTKYESFRRQLNLYGFSRVNRGADRGVVTHPYFIEGARWLCGNVIRKTNEKVSSNNS